MPTSSGVPFTGFPVAGLPEERDPPTPKPGKAVRAVPERLHALDEHGAERTYLEVTFPRVIGYRFDVRPISSPPDSTPRTARSSPRRTSRRPR